MCAHTYSFLKIKIFNIILFEANHLRFKNKFQNKIFNIILFDTPNDFQSPLFQFILIEKILGIREVQWVYCVNQRVGGFRGSKRKDGDDTIELTSPEKSFFVFCILIIIIAV